jgi:predicted O-methyltransferase YrrM
MENEYPWMNQKEVELIEKYLNKDKIMLEWGSGGSTLYFSKRVKILYSIEHDKTYYNKIKKMIPENVKYFHIEPNKTVPATESDFESYKDYIEIVQTFDQKFDAVLIDGRSRVECAKYVLNFLKKDGVVFVHDFWKKKRTRYRPILEYYNEIESVKDTLQTLIILKKK